MIKDEEIEKALDYLRDSAEDASEARAERLYLEQYRKSKKAILKKQSNATSNAAQEDDAYAHPDYIEFLEGLRVAIEKDEKHRFLLAAAEAKIDAWRTEKSFNKTMGLIT